MIGPVPGTPTPWRCHASEDSPDFWSISRVEPYDDIAYFTLHSREVKAADVAAIVHRVNNWDAEQAKLAALVEAILAVVNATRAYLPPDGIDAKECISRILEATDNPTINPIILEAENGRN